MPFVAMIEQLKGQTWATAGGSTATDEVTIGRVDDYRIIREIGRGGMGIVLEAEHESLGRRVALKVLPSRLFRDDKYVARFRREAQAAAKLHHPNIVPVFGVGECEGHHYYVMEFIEGHGLNETINSLRHEALTVDERDVLTANTAPLSDTPSSSVAKRPTVTLKANVPARWIAELGAQAASGLDYAHRQGILHRDIKPANLLLDESDTVWITDFGLAKHTDSASLTNTGDIIGTPQYMAPENFDGVSDARSDVYSLGLTLYELLTLRPAFDASSAATLLQKASRESPVPPRKLAPSVPRDLETIVLKAIARDPDHRYQTAGELHDDLRNFLQDRPILARRANPAQRLWRWRRRNPAVAALSAASIGLLVTIAVVSAVGNYQTGRALQSLRYEHNRAESTLRLAQRALGDAVQQSQRAELNLAIALRAFEQIMDNIAARDVTQSVIIGETPSAGAESSLTAADVALLETLLAFFEDFAGANTTSLLAETAAARARVGDILQRLGRLDEADDSYQRALEMYASLAEQTRIDLDVTVGRARILNELAITASRRGAILQATERHAEARALLEHVVAPESTIAHGTEAGSAPSATNESQAARFELARTLSLFASMGSRVGMENPVIPVHPAGPQPGRPPFAGPTFAGVTLPQTARVKEEAEANRRAIRLLTTLASEAPDNFKFQLALARAHRDHVLLAMRSGDWQSAAQASQAAIKHLDDLLGDFPDSPAIRYELANALCTPIATGPDALNRALRAKDITAGLLAANPNLKEYQRLDGRVLSRLTELRQGVGQPNLTPPSPAIAPATE